MSGVVGPNTSPHIVMQAEGVAFITPSYSNDYELASDLCASLDKFVQFPFEHILFVPARDRVMFDTLARPHRRVITREQILRSHGFHRLPLPTMMELPFRPPMRLHEQYYLKGVGRVGGWLVQQIVKLAATEATEAPLILFADSDVVLIRSLALGQFFTNGTLNLQQHLRGRDLDTHQTWRRSAHRLLGVTAPRGEAFNYIGQLIPWDRRILKGLLAHIETVNGCDWRIAIAKEKTVSEYILYGEYVIEILGAPSDYVPKDMKLYNSVWSPDAHVNPDMLLTGLRPQTVALHIQSTNPIPIAERRAAVAAVERRARESPGV